MNENPSSWESVTCILCDGHTPYQVIWPDNKLGDIVRCRNCGLAYRNPRRTESYLINHFTEEWTEARPAFYLEDYRLINLKKIAHWIVSNPFGWGSILDIGSSYGNLLSQFPDSWHRAGIEPSGAACQICQGRLPEAGIYQGTLSNVTLPEQSFDFITMVDTVYYLPHPLRDFARIYNLLKPSGIALIESPNFSNRRYVYRLMGHTFDDTWMYFYSPSTLAQLLRKSGLKVIDRFDLPGHQVGGTKRLAKILTWFEYYTTRIIFTSSKHTIDIVPHFVLVAQRS